MIAFALILLLGAVLIAVGLGAALWTVHSRGKQARQRLAEESHQRSLELAQRCDVIEARQRRLQRLQSVDHLAFLATVGSKGGHWQESTSNDLHRYIAALYSEAEHSEADTDRQASTVENVPVGSGPHS